MRHTVSRSFVTALAILAISCLSWTRTAHASGTAGNSSGGDPIASMGGEPIDNFWHFNVMFCTDGVLLYAGQWGASSQNEAYAVQLADVTATPSGGAAQDLGPGSPMNIAGAADNSGPLLSQSLAYQYTPQSPTTPITATIFRNDHGQTSPLEDPPDGDSDNDEVGSDGDGVSGTDESGFDDILPISGTVQPCQVGSIMTMGVERLVMPTPGVDPFLPDGSNGWFVSATQITLSATDNTAASPGGITTYYSVDDSSCAPGHTAACSTYSGPFTVTDSPHTIYFFSTDAAGNVEKQQESLTVSQDTHAPTVTCNAASFLLNQSPAQGSASVSDPASGLDAGTHSTYPFTANTTAVGTFTATTTPSPLTVGDNAGNSATVSPSCPYTVTFNAPRLVYNPTTKNSGSSVPIKIQLLDANGTNVSSVSTTVTALCVVKQPTTTCGNAPAINKPFTYLVFDQGPGYQYNLKTTGLAARTSYYLLYTAGADPTVYRAPFLLG